MRLPRSACEITGVARAELDVQLPGLVTGRYLGGLSIREGHGETPTYEGSAQARRRDCIEFMAEVITSGVTMTFAAHEGRSR